jgi:hypothetical protein
VDIVQADEKIDNEIKSCLAKYLCIVVSGFIETSIQDIYSDYTQKRAQTNVISYVSKKLAGFKNPKIGKILTLSGGFCKGWASELEVLIKNEEIGDSINSLVDNRNHIAHGIDIGITYSGIKGYYSNSIKLLKIIDKQCSKQA